MPNSDVIPASASVASTGVGLRYIGRHCFGFSGIVNDAPGSSSAVATMFDFTSNSQYAIISLDLITDAKAGENVYVELTLKGQTAYKGVWDDSPAKANARPLFTVLLPPFTDTIFKWGSSSNKNATALITGRVYGAD